jgi:hypothetical protein
MLCSMGQGNVPSHTFLARGWDRCLGEFLTPRHLILSPYVVFMNIPGVKVVRLGQSLHVFLNTHTLRGHRQCDLQVEYPRLPRR